VSDALEIRPVGAEERETACRLIFDPPGPEARGLLGGEARARELGREILRLGIHPRPDHEVIAAFEAGRPLGVLVLEDTGRGAGRTGGGMLGIVPLALRSFAPWQLPGLAWRSWLRSRLDFPLPPGALHVVELHVTPERRGRGLGARLLAHAEALARSRGRARLVLSTLVHNPARRLYARAGYRVAAERTAPGYAAFTGSPGRVLLEKPLEPVAPTCGA